MTTNFFSNSFSTRKDFPTQHTRNNIPHQEMATHHRQAMKRRWERKQQRALRFVEEDDEDETTTTTTTQTTTTSALQQLSSSTNNDENEDALEVLANTVNVTKDGNYVTKEEFDFAMQAAQNALKAKTHANHMLTLQAKAAMQNAVMALKITEKEVRKDSFRERARGRAGNHFNRMFLTTLFRLFRPFLSFFYCALRRRLTALKSLLIFYHPRSVKRCERNWRI